MADGREQGEHGKDANKASRKTPTGLVLLCVDSQRYALAEGFRWTYSTSSVARSTSVCSLAISVSDRVSAFISYGEGAIILIVIGNGTGKSSLIFFIQRRTCKRWRFSLRARLLSASASDAWRSLACKLSRCRETFALSWEGEARRTTQMRRIVRMRGQGSVLALQSAETYPSSGPGGAGLRRKLVSLQLPRKQ